MTQVNEVIYFFTIIFIVFMLRGKALDFLLLCFFFCNAIVAFVNHSWFNAFVFFYMILHFFHRKDLANTKPVSTFRMVDKNTAI